MNPRSLKAILLLILSYAAIFAISWMNNSSGRPLSLLYMDFSTFPAKADYTLLLMPMLGFAFVYMLFPYLKSEFGFGKTFTKYVFPAAFIILSALAFLLAVYIYFLDIGLRAGLGFDLSQFNLNYQEMFLASTFIYFVLGGVLGWASRQLIDHFESR